MECKFTVIIIINFVLLSTKPCFSNFSNSTITFDRNQPTLQKPNNTQSEEVTNITLPDCMEMTIPNSDFYIGTNNTLDLRTDYGIINIATYNWTSHDGAVNICYPLTPQLLNCRLQEYNSSDYTILNYTFVQNGTNFKANLGDFYIDNDNQDTAFTCEKPIIYTDVPRCHYLVVDNSNYTIYKNDSMYISIINFTINRPSYTLEDNRAANICIPLRLNLFQCVLWVLAPEDYKILPNKQIYHVEHETSFNYDQYFPYGSSDYVICAYDQPPPTPSYYDMYVIFTIISSACLIVTVIIQLSLDSFVHMSCSSKSLLCFMLSMMVEYVSDTARKFTPSEELTHTVCYTFFVIQYFFSMSAFFWLSIVSFDVWHFFTEMQTSPSLCRLCLRSKHQFIYYFVLATGIPIVLLILALIVDYNTTLQQALGLYPRICEMCWFNEVPSSWVFYYGPLSVIMIFNLMCFIMTVVILQYASQGTEMVNKHKTKQVFFVCVKLFVVMGLSWIAQVLCYTIEYDEYWYISNAITSLQGIAIFVVYICKYETYQLILMKFFPKKAIKNMENHRKSLQHTSSTMTVTSEFSLSDMYEDNYHHG